MTDETTTQTSEAKAEKKLKFHAVLKDGTVIQHHNQKAFEVNVSKHAPDTILFAVKGDELKPRAETHISFDPA